MKAFMTNGTINFLGKLEAKYPDINFHLMSSSSGGLAYYEEAEDKNVFSSGREYDLVIQSGEIQAQGYVVMNNIPVTEDDRPVFEDRFKQQSREVDKMPGFQAFRFLRPKTGNKYIVLVQWRSTEDFENWKNSDQFVNTHQRRTTKPPAYFADKAFASSYHMYDPEK